MAAGAGTRIGDGDARARRRRLRPARRNAAPRRTRCARPGLQSPRRDSRTSSRCARAVGRRYRPRTAHAALHPARRNPGAAGQGARADAAGSGIVERRVRAPRRPDRGLVPAIARRRRRARLSFRVTRPVRAGARCARAPRARLHRRRPLARAVDRGTSTGTRRCAATDPAGRQPAGKRSALYRCTRAHSRRGLGGCGAGTADRRGHAARRAGSRTAAAVRSPVPGRILAHARPGRRRAWSVDLPPDPRRPWRHEPGRSFSARRTAHRRAVAAGRDGNSMSAGFSRPSAAALGAHVLIVEDEPKIAALLRDYLLASDYRVSVLETGAGAVEWVRVHGPDAVLLDVMLPGENGLAICRGIRTFSTIPI